MEKGTSQFFRSAGRCGAMRHGVPAGMPLGCPLPACSWGNNLIFQKTLIFRKSLQICGQGHGQGMHPRPRPRHAAKAKAAPYGHAAAKAKAAPMGRQRRPRHACLLACMLPRPRHAAKAMACLRGHAGMPLGAGRWARWHAPGRRQQQGPSMPRGRGRGMPRGWDAKAVACPWDPYKAMAALGGATAAKPR